MSVVVGYVPNERGKAALHAALEETRFRGGPLVVVNSTRADRLVDPRYAQEDGLTELEETLSRAGADYELRHFASRETAAEDLLGVAREVSAELLVIGVRRRTPVGKLLLGSTAQTVILEAPCPVLAVKT
ncbi:MAG TPA: universal stress protein [Nocardioidaceae bacterium]|nr:universal stress protein [Nocardioidaceae bacterium]